MTKMAKNYEYLPLKWSMVITRIENGKRLMACQKVQK